MLYAVRASLLVALLAGGNCGTETCTRPAPPMTAARATEIAPGIETGIAVSTTYIFGDCRAEEMDALLICGSAERCAKQRRALRVFVVPLNTSLALGECAPALSVEDMAMKAVVDMATSEGSGELVVDVEPGRYTVYVTKDGRCAVCGLSEQAESCVVEVIGGRVTARDLVLDEATR